MPCSLTSRNWDQLDLTFRVIAYKRFNCSYYSNSYNIQIGGSLVSVIFTKAVDKTDKTKGKSPRVFKSCKLYALKDIKDKRD